MQRENELRFMAQDISETIREAAWDGEWNKVCTRITHLFPGTYCALLSEHKQRPEFGLAVSDGIEQSFIKQFVEHYAAVNPWQSLWNETPSGTVLVSERDNPASLYHGTEYYEDWMSKVGDFDAAVGMLVYNSEVEKTYLPVHYSRRYSDVYDAELEYVFANLNPVLSDAVRVNMKLREYGKRQNSLASIVNRDDTICFVVDELMCLQNANSLALDEFKNGDLLTCRNSIVKFSDSKSNNQFRASCSALLHNRSDAIGRFVIKQRKRSVIVSVSLLPGALTNGLIFSCRQFLLEISEPLANTTMPSMNLLTQMYDLTPTEAQVCIQLSAGFSLKDACGNLCISYENGRSRLKNIFQKTNTNTQSDLRCILAYF